MKEIFAVLIVVGGFYMGYTQYSNIITPIQELPATLESEFTPVEAETPEISNTLEE